MEIMEKKDVIISEIGDLVIFLKELQADCGEEILWHNYMKKIDELEKQIDLLTRGDGIWECMSLSRMMLSDL